MYVCGWGWLLCGFDSVLFGSFLCSYLTMLQFSNYSVYCVFHAGWAQCPPVRSAAATPTSYSTSWPPPHTANIRRVGFRNCEGVISWTKLGLKMRARLPAGRKRQLVERVLPLQTVNVEHKDMLLRKINTLWPSFQGGFEGKGWMWKHIWTSSWAHKCKWNWSDTDKIGLPLSKKKCRNLAQGSAESKCLFSVLLCTLNMNY